MRSYLNNGGAVTDRLARGLGDDDENLALLWNWALAQRWAWDELQRRLRVCLDQGRAPTGVLATWAASVATDGRKPPRRNEHDDRDWRVYAVVKSLVEWGHCRSEHAAVVLVADELSKTPEAVYSMLRKIRQPPYVEKAR